MPKRNTSLRKDMLSEPAAVYGGPVGEVVLYQAPAGTVQLKVRLEQETIWMNSKANGAAL